MSIPKLTKDLAVIQKLSDLPNSTEGLTAAQLKAKFDEAPLEIQKWLNENLVPSITPENIPFPASTEIAGDTLLAAIKSVHEQVKDASTGAIVNGSVTKEKLSPELLERVYGGRPWVSLNTPTAAQNSQTNFPVGQIWLCPEFTIENLAGEDWTANGCTVTGDRNLLTITGNGTVTNAYITQVLSNLGEDGDRVYVFVRPQNMDIELSSVTVSLNGEAGKPASQSIFEGIVTGGVVTVRIDAVWPTTSLAVGSLEIANYAVVNVDRIVRDTGAEDMYNWATYLSALLPLDSYTSPEELYIQTINGQWWPFGKVVYPVERGGTGFSLVAVGDLLYGADGNVMQRLAAGASGSILRMHGGVPAWDSVASAFVDISGLRVVTGKYTGNGTPRTVSLGVTPVLFALCLMREKYAGSHCYYGTPVFFIQGGYEEDRYEYTDNLGDEWYYYSRATVDGSNFKLTGNSSRAELYSANGVEYRWIALALATVD